MKRKKSRKWRRETEGRRRERKEKKQKESGSKWFFNALAIIFLLDNHAISPDMPVISEFLLHLNYALPT